MSHHVPSVAVRWAAVVLLLAAATTTVPSRAQEDAAAEARARFQSGVELFRAEDWAGALAAFAASFELLPNPSLRYNIGVCRYNLGQLEESAFELRLYLEEMDPSLIPTERRDDVERILAAIAARFGSLEIRVSAEGATVRVDGVEQGRSPLPAALTVPAGTHHVEVALDGYAPFERDVEVEPGATRPLDAVLAAAAVEPPPVEPPPVENPPVENPPVEPPPVEPPPVVAEEDGGISPAWWKTFANVAGALAVGGAVTGGLVLWKQSQFETAVSDCRRGASAECAEGYDIASDGEALGSATTALLILAGAAAATAVTMLFFTDFGDDEEAEEPAATGVAVGASPTFDPAGGAVAGGMLTTTIRF
jgi:hypothetical protein